MTDSDSYLISKFRDMAMSDRTDMLSKEVAWIPDSNGSSYNGQIVFDLSSFGQTNKWLSYSEAYLEIPYVIAAKADADWSTFITANSVFMKDGFHELIDNVAVEFNQKTVCQVQNFTNVHTQFKLLSSSSTEDIIKNGALNGFFGDAIENYTYSATAASSGIGYINNFDTQRKTATTAFDVAAKDTEFPTLTAAQSINSGRSYYRNDGGSAAARYYYWVVMAQIRLRDITDFFDKIPLCKTTDVRLIVTYNSAQCVINGTAANPSLLSVTSYQQLSGHVCPFLVTVAPTTTGGNLTIRSNVVKHGLSGGADQTLAINQCRMYVPLYKIADSVSLAMIQSFPTTTFEYNDIYTYVVPSITAGSSFVHTLTTGIVNPQYVVVIAYPKTNGLAGLGVATYQSPFDSAPGTSSNIILGEFNIQVAGLNVFQANERYDWEQFSDELVKINAVNGNNTTGMTSGYLSYDKWQKAYRMYVADLRRREQSNDNVTKSIVVSATNTAGCEIELLCFVAYRKTLSINTSTGNVSE